MLEEIVARKPTQRVGGQIVLGDVIDQINGKDVRSVAELASDASFKETKVQPAFEPACPGCETPAIGTISCPRP